MTQNPQLIASNPDISCFVMASAGTGKTKMLVDRLLRLLFKGHPLSSILCLTFTKAGAEEMKQRLIDRSCLLLNMEEHELIAYLNSLNIHVNDFSKEKAKSLFFELLNEQQSLKIQTIHSFCQNIMEASAWQLPFTPPFSVMEEMEKKAMILKSLESVSQDASFKELFDSLIATMSMSQFLNLLSDAIRLDDAMIQKSMIPLDAPLSNHTNDLKRHIESLPPSILDNLLKNNQTLQDVFLTKDGTARKKIFKKDLLKQHPGLEELSFEIAFLFEDLLDQKKHNSVAELNYAFFSILRAVKNHYTSLKLKKSLLDFDDLILFTHTILKSSNFPEVEQRLGYKLKAILIDEAQDTSALQWDIISEIVQNMLLSDDKGEANLLIVGDLKQAIYSFQGADPDLFLKKEDDFKKLFDHFKKPFKVVRLKTSYRCLERVLTSVDHFFNTHPEGLYLEESNLEHVPFREGEGIVTVFEEMESKEDLLPQVGWSLPDFRISLNKKLKSLSDSIVSLVVKLINDDKKSPKDIMILVRNRSQLVDLLTKDFYAKNIPCSGLDRFSILEHPMVLDFLNMFEFLSFKGNDFAFMSILKTAWYKVNGIDEDVLQNIALTFEKNLYSNLLNNFDTIDLLNEKEDLKTFTEKIKNYLSKVDYIPLTSFLTLLWKDAHSNFLSLYGLEALEIYESLYMILFELEKKHGMTLQEVIFHLKTEDIEIKKDVTSQTFDQIRIMTIHGSKGLESPIVILADMNIRQTLQKEKLLFVHDRFILKPSDQDCPKSLKPFKDETLINLKEEEQRLLYVAMTRARDRLYIFGKTANIDGSIYQKLKDILGVTPQPLVVSDHFLWKNDQSSLCDIPAHFFLDVDKSQLFQPDFVKSDAISRGILIHKLLEDLSEIEKSRRENYVHQFILNHSLYLKNDDAKNIIALMEDKSFEIFFQKSDLNEMSFVFEGKLLRIDRFIQKDNKSIILDFKSGKRSLHKLKSYTQQMMLYKKAISTLYPTTNVETYILWIDEWKLDKVDKIINEDSNDFDRV
ncbi:MAG: ATP-dependent helicase/nuclease subunit A [Holosporales bacterium]